MVDRFPSFAGLKAFFAVATVDSVSKAAERLGISSSAISHQLKNLEAELGVRLFKRKKGKLYLTADGTLYFQAVKNPLASILEATNDIRSKFGRRRVTLTLTPSFAANWLMPRMRDLGKEHPELELNLVTTTRVVNMSKENIDLAIRRGNGVWPSCKSELLMKEDIIPVLSPMLWDTIKSVNINSALSKTRALVNTTLLSEWDDWCAACDLQPPDSKLRYNLETYELSIQAARDGLGIALGRRPFVEEFFARGDLVSPFDGLDSGSVQYFVLWREDVELTLSAKKILRWIRAQITVK